MLQNSKKVFKFFSLITITVLFILVVFQIVGYFVFSNNLNYVDIISSTFNSTYPDNSWVCLDDTIPISQKLKIEHYLTNLNMKVYFGIKSIPAQHIHKSVEPFVVTEYYTDGCYLNIIHQKKGMFHMTVKYWTRDGLPKKCTLICKDEMVWVLYKWVLIGPDKKLWKYLH